VVPGELLLLHEVANTNDPMATAAASAAKKRMKMLLL
jgi:hypothetical protein